VTELKVGLVLSGGGAKGAYQVGVLKALRELGAQVDAVAGASIGALNGAILASAPSLDDGIKRLELVWNLLSEKSPLQINAPGYVRLLLATGLRLNGQNYLFGLLRAAESAIPTLMSRLPPNYRWAIDQIKGWGAYFPTDRESAAANDDGVLSNDPLQRIMDEYLDFDGLANGIPLYVSAFRTSGGVLDIVQCALAELGLRNTQDSEFFHVQSLDRSIQKEVLLASAALPLIFAPQEVDGKKYTDGGQGGWQTVQGNTPIQPLIDAGCKLIIVTHLNDGSLWSRASFPDTTILEIRPQRSISRDAGVLGGARDVLGFDSSRIDSWIDQGYEDTMVCVGRVMGAVKSRSSLKQSQSALHAIDQALEPSAVTMRNAMNRLNSG